MIHFHLTIDNQPACESTKVRVSHVTKQAGSDCPHCGFEFLSSAEIAAFNLRELMEREQVAGEVRVIPGQCWRAA